jgi:TonB family protein
MPSIKPFLLCSLALHLLVAGALLFWGTGLFGYPKEEVRVLTVMLVSDDRAGGGSAGGEQKADSRGKKTAVHYSLAASLPSAGEPGPVKTGPGESAQTRQALHSGHEESDKRVGYNTGKEDKITAAPKGEGATSSGAVGGQSNAVADGGRIALLPGNGEGKGWGTGKGDGWGVGGEGQLYVKGGYQLTPKYPPAARRQSREGTTVLKLKISPEGKVQEVLLEQSSGHQDLDEAALEAVKSWRFEPPQREGQKVSLWARVPIKFQLRNK